MRYFGRFLIAGLLVASCCLLVGCCSSNLTRTGFNTFLLDGWAEDRGQAERRLNRDASKLCYDEYTVIKRKVTPYAGDQFRYIFEVECLCDVNEEFYDFNSNQGAVYIFY